MDFSLFLIRRLLWSVLVLLGLSLLIFTIARIVPGDPARMALGPLAQQEQVDNLREKMGLNDPAPVQYVRYLGGALQGDLGTSLLTQRSVSKDLKTAFPATLELILYTLILTILFGIPLGVIAAHNKDGVADTITRFIALFGVVTPGFFIAILLQLLAGYVLKVLPVSGRLDPNLDFIPTITGLMTIDSLLEGQWAVCWDALKHLLLPCLSLCAASMGQVARITRSSMIDISQRQYIKTARAYGVAEWKIALKYMLRPSFIPTLTILGLEFASLLGNAFLVEMVFTWPGMASYGVRAMLQNDFNAIMGVVLVTGVMFVLINLLVDLLIGVVDPRVRLKGA